MMNRRRMTYSAIAVILLVAAGPALPQAPGRGIVDRPGGDLKIWSEFVALLKSGGFTPDRIEPMGRDESLREPLMGFLKQMRSTARWPEWDGVPEIQRIGIKVNFIIPLSFGNDPAASYCFTFLDYRDHWMFHHLEAVFIRLDKTPPPPTSVFPDTTEAQKAWDREEGYWSKIVQWYAVLVPEKGKEFFFNLMRDGGGYFVWATSRAPFLAPHQAFILFLCWEQANLRGQSAAPAIVRLEQLTDEDAVVRLRPFYFMLYRSAAHLKQIIGFDAYQELFEIIWQDRARAAGWTLKIAYQDVDGILECLFRFHRAPGR